MKYFLLAILVTIVLFVDISKGYGQCSSCSVTVNVSGTSSAGITATAANQIVCITGSGTYNGSINLNYQNNVTLCVGNNITVSTSATVSNTPTNARINNYGTWNNSMNVGSGLYQSGVIYNNYGTVNTDQIQLNSNTINNYGSFNVTGGVIVNSGSNINTFAGSTMYMGGNLTVNSGGIVTLAGVMGVGGSVTNNNIIRGGGGPCGGLDVTGTFTNNGSGIIQNNGGLVINKTPSPNSGTLEPTVGVSNINPSITSQPSNVSTCPGGNASFTVATTPAANTYQWQVQTGGAGPFTSIAGQTGSTLNLSGVTSGMNGSVYRVLVYSCPNFVISNSATLTVNPNVSGTIASTNVNCNGALTGSITITPSGGSGSYHYSINGGTTWQSSATYTGLGAGSYNVRIRDAGNTSCSAILNASYSITQPALLTASISKTNVLCNGASTGAITITSPSGGVSPYQYSINGGSYQSSGSFTGLAAGSYTLNIRDANNCVVALPSQSITQPSLLSATVSKTNVLCNGASTGAITITSPSGGVSSYQYSINGGAYQSGGSFTGLAAGSYTLNIRDANNCVVALPSQTITQPTLLSATVSKTNVLCNGASTGAITITSPSGGVSPYQYSINGGAYQSSGSFTGLAAGSYTLNIRDANNCVVALPSQTITQPTLLSATVSKTNVLCNGASTGAITITSPLGGVSPYQYSINGGSYQSSGSFTGLAAGSYTLNIRDANNCVVALPSQTITQPTLLSATVSKTNVLCNGASTGAITITSPSGGVSPYQYSINGGAYQSSGSFTGLAAGSYTLNIRDANNCVVALPSQTITQPTVLSASETHTDALCNGASSGTATITATGGTAPYSGIGTFTGLAAGTHSFTVTDANGCSSTVSVVIGEPTVLST
ncbi:MAG: hypothetical protein NVV82_09870 [Sporocytophaga sp.]|nr:hypothetical protein [Sporocytophaga sp.]